MGKKHLLIAAAGTCLLLGISGAKAADVEVMPEPVAEHDWYVSLFGGATWLDDVDINYDYFGSPNDAELETKTGFIVGGAFGTHLTDDIRVEIEAAYSENKLKEIDFEGPGGQYDIHGKFGILTFMGNLWYDIPLSDDLKPYVGGGAGVAIVDGDFAYEPDDGDDTGFDSSEVAFAFQVGAGLRWAVSDNLTLDVGYRFKGIDGPTFDGGDFAGSDEYDADWLYSHNVIAGISFGF